MPRRGRQALCFPLLTELSQDPRSPNESMLRLQSSPRAELSAYCRTCSAFDAQLGAQGNLLRARQVLYYLMPQSELKPEGLGRHQSLQR